ncbi:MAG: hypothetical protein ACR2HP_17480 [Ilumatobacteraceae bacterium]
MGNSFVTRDFVLPQPGDSLATIAARELPERADGAGLLQAWNPHLALRLSPIDGLLCTDVVYTDPPA